MRRFIKYITISVLLFVLYFSIAIYYAGATFIKNMDIAIAANPGNGMDNTPFYMIPGDHFEQFYRYSLPKANFSRGKPLYESSYQFNLSENQPNFFEGLIFFPFSLINSILAWPFGNILAYNMMVLLSFPLVGGAMYLLVFSLTRHHPAALISSLLLMLLPHRTTFLFGEMVYGMDLCWPPLILLSFEKLVQTLHKKYVIALGLFIFFYATSNFQGMYLFSLFSLPYFFIRGLEMLQNDALRNRDKIITLALVALSLIPSVVYLALVRQLIGDSGLSSGQNYSETELYSPTIKHIFVFANSAGQETKLYLGWLFFLFPIFFLIFGIRGCFQFVTMQLSKLERQLLVLSCFIFLLSYAFCFGTNLDQYVGLKIYRWYFDNIPGANGIRTPGRLMNTAGFFFALIIGFVIKGIFLRYFDIRHLKPLLTWAFTVLIGLGIIWNFHFTNAIMVLLDEDNLAYSTIKDTKGIVFAVPTQPGALDHYNATFLYYAQKYNLRMFVGRSSMYPKEWNQAITPLLEINNGKFDQTLWEHFLKLGITHVVVHATEFEPRVSYLVVARLRANPFLTLIAQSNNNVYIFKLNRQLPDQNLNVIDVWDNIDLTLLRQDDFQKPHYLDGWYTRESYPDHPPFRWMHGRNSNIVAFAREKQFSELEFAYQCPLTPPQEGQQSLVVRLNGQKVLGSEYLLKGNWRKYYAKFNGLINSNHLFIEFSTEQIYKNPPNPHDYGCAISDILLR